MSRIKYIFLSFFLVCSGGHLYAQNNGVNVVSTAVPFLRIPHDAATSGMGSAGIATLPNINAVYWNLAKLPFSESASGVVANYSPWLKEYTNDMYVASLAAYMKLNDKEALHGMVRYFNPGSLQFTDNNGNKLQSYHPNEWGIDVGYSRKLSDHLGLGVAMRYIRSDLAKGVQNGSSYKAGNAVAGDLGLYYDARKNETGWSFGAVLSNLGSKISYLKNDDQKDFLPANLGMGASYTKLVDDENRVTIALDINKLLVPTAPQDSASLQSYRNKSVVGSWFSSLGDAPGGFGEELKEIQVSAGVEYWYNNLFSVRAGYFYENKNKGGRSCFTTGASIRYNFITANFSYLAPASSAGTRNPLSNTLVFGVAFSFDKQ